MDTRCAGGVDGYQEANWEMHTNWHRSLRREAVRSGDANGAHRHMQIKAAIDRLLLVSAEEVHMFLVLPG